MESLKRIQQFIRYWYVRYLLVTELYMVDVWERNIVHVLLALLFVLFWYFNYSIVTTCVSQLTSKNTFVVEMI